MTVTVNVLEDQPNLTQQLQSGKKFNAVTIASIFTQLERLGYADFTFTIDGKFGDKKIAIMATRREKQKETELRLAKEQEVDGVSLNKLRNKFKER